MGATPMCQSTLRPNRLRGFAPLFSSPSGGVHHWQCLSRSLFVEVLLFYVVGTGVVKAVMRSDTASDTSSA